MEEGTRTALLVEGQLDEGIVKRVVEAALEAPPADRVRAALEAAIDEAEVDPAAARSALASLRGDHQRLAQLEAWLGGRPERATFDLGAAIQIAYAELGSSAPEPRRLTADLLGWLEGGREADPST